MDPSLSPLDAELRRSGATMVDRDGWVLAAHFGSALGEAAVCRSAVGITDRSDRGTVEVTGGEADVDAALEQLDRFGDRAWWKRMDLERAIVRCERADVDAVVFAMRRSENASVEQLDWVFAGIGLIGPSAERLIHAARAGTPGLPAIVLQEEPGTFELLVPAEEAVTAWRALMDAGRPLHVACVGIDALEHLDAADHLGHPGRPAA